MAPSTIGRSRLLRRSTEIFSKYLSQLYFSLFAGQGLTEGQVKEKLRSDESQTQISELERINIEADCVGHLDAWIAVAGGSTDDAAQKLNFQLPSVQFDAPHREPGSPTFNQALHFLSTPNKPLSVLPQWLVLRGFSMFPCSQIARHHKCSER
jgi:hypothetical protein